jgi:hypothetical protein
LNASPNANARCSRKRLHQSATAPSDDAAAKPDTTAEAKKIVRKEIGAN